METERKKIIHPILGEIEVEILPYTLHITDTSGNVIETKSFRLFWPLQPFFPLLNMLFYLSNLIKTIPPSDYNKAIPNTPSSEYKLLIERTLKLLWFYTFFCITEERFYKRKFNLEVIRYYLKKEMKPVAGSGNLAQIEQKSYKDILQIFSSAPPECKNFIFRNKPLEPAFEDKKYYPIWDKILDVLYKEINKYENEIGKEFLDIQHIPDNKKWKKEFCEIIKKWRGKFKKTIMQKLSSEGISIDEKSEIFEKLWSSALQNYFYIFKKAYKLLYKHIRNELTYPERRAFILLYLCQIKISKFFVIPVGWTPSHFIDYFFKNPDENTRALLLYASIFKQTREKDILEELENGFHRFLNAYQFQLALQQAEDIEKKEKGKYILMEDVCPTGPFDLSFQLPQKLERKIATDDFLEKFLNNLTEIEKKVLEERIEGYKQKDIAERLNISPQRVNKLLKNIHKKGEKIKNQIPENYRKILLSS